MKVSIAANVWRNAIRCDARIAHRGATSASSPWRRRVLHGSSQLFTLFDRTGERLGTIVAPGGPIELNANGATFYLRREYRSTD